MNLTMPVVGILRGVEAEFFQRIVASSFDSGLQAIEVTVNTPGAFEMVRDSRRLVRAGQMLGMGTICTLDDARQAVDAGAMFLVTPQFSREVVEYGVAQNIPVIAGALTPTEIYNAWRAGASMVKVFPCGAMGGAQYIKDLRGPFDSLPLAAVGGVSVENVARYFESGVQAVGVSTALFGKEALETKDITAVSNNIKKFTAHVEQVIQGLE